tara:strand:- start:720 stop:932 length:213 start_codon:yes stop_codon:yes gene_type:complete
MKKILEKIHVVLKRGIDLSLPFLCLGIILSLITGDSLFGWDPIGNIKKLGTENIIGLAALLILYFQINRH